MFSLGRVKKWIGLYTNSTNSSHAILKEYAAKDFLLKKSIQKNSNHILALTFATDSATGNYISYKMQG